MTAIRPVAASSTYTQKESNLKGIKGDLKGSQVTPVGQMAAIVSHKVKKFLVVAALITCVATFLFGIGLGLGLCLFAAGSSSLLSTAIVAPAIAIIGIKWMIVGAAVSTFVGALGMAGSISFLTNLAKFAANAREEQESKRVNHKQKVDHSHKIPSPSTVLSPTKVEESPQLKKETVSKEKKGRAKSPEGRSNTIDLSNKRLKAQDIPESVWHETDVDTLVLNGNSLKTLPAEIARLSKLRTLGMRNNSISQLPEAFANLRRLTEIDLSLNDLEALPETVSKMRQLENLNLNNNRLEGMPESIYEMTKLKTLYLSGSKQIKLLSSKIAQLSHLRDLDLSDTGLTALPSQIGKLVHLTKLNIAWNGIKKLPKEMGQLKKLTHLSIYANPLESIPDWIADLPNLQILAISDEQEGALPKQLDRKRVEVKKQVRW